MHASALLKGYGNWQQKCNSCWKFRMALPYFLRNTIKLKLGRSLLAGWHFCIYGFFFKKAEGHSLCNFWLLIEYRNGTFAKTTFSQLMFNITQTSFTLDIPLTLIYSIKIILPSSMTKHMPLLRMRLELILIS